VPDCSGPGLRLHGTTCCESVGEGDRRYPGEVYLQCRGPQIGKPCKSKNDCDIVCSCALPGALGKDEDGPKDGTPGVTGHCDGTLRVGTWMCQIDEKGLVAHWIVD
jgi:hypothetical protein